MAYPTIEDIETSGSIEYSSITASIPVCNFGDLILVFISVDDTSVNFSIDTDVSGSNWHQLEKHSSSGNTAAAYYKIADGSDLLTINLSSTQTGSSIVYRISGTNKQEPESEYYITSGANANPPSLTPSKGAYDYLWIVYAGIEGDVIASAAPSGFSGLTTYLSPSIGSSGSSAYLEYNTGIVYDPGAFISSSANYIAFTVCVAPENVGGIGISNTFYYNLNM